ncbi:MAG: hypothetical protein SVK08_08360 [Halobacteriota archaeon]|nr:hypothetical protein [Halobacteriota archaeon]
MVLQIEESVKFLRREMSFSSLNVIKNLEIGAFTNKELFQQGLEEVFRKFPKLKEKTHSKAGTMSGGEQKGLR